MSSPTVLGVIAARNAEATICASVRSLAGQSGDFRLHVVVVDDGSEDRTGQRVLDMALPNVELIRCEETIGRAAARNLAVSSATSDYIAIQDADDCSFPGRIDRTLRHTKRLKAAAVGGQAIFWDERLGAWRLRRYPTSALEVEADLAAGRMPLSHTTCLISTAAFEAVGGYDSSLVRAQDLDLMLKLSTLGAISSIQADLARYTHQVMLPYQYWHENQRYTREAATKNGIKLPHRTIPSRAHYYASMARRIRTFAATSRQAAVDLKAAKCLK